MGQQKRQQKLAKRIFLSSSPPPPCPPPSPGWQIHQEVCSYWAAVYKLQSRNLRLAHIDHETGRETSYQHSVSTNCRFILQSLQPTGGDQIFSNIRQELSLLKNKTSVTLQWIPSHCGVGGNDKADRLSKMGRKLEHLHTPCPTVKQRPS